MTQTLCQSTPLTSKTSPRGKDPSSPRPNLFIVGAPKCGTTSLAAWLAKHDDVFMSGTNTSFQQDAGLKEPNYFGHDLGTYIQTEEEYLALFRDGSHAKIRGESTVWYLYSKSAAREIQAFNPDARIIIMLRNPVDMMYSLHSQQLFDLRSEDIADFRKALEAEPERRAGRRLPARMGRHPEWLYYRDIAQFTEQVRRYLDVFGRERVLVILFDDLVKQPRAVYENVCRFLDLAPIDDLEFRNANPHTAWKSRSLRNLLHKSPLLPLARYVLPIKSIRRRLYGALWKMNLSTSPRKPMDPQLRRELTEEFSPEVQRLGELLGRDLSSWSRLPNS